MKPLHIATSSLSNTIYVGNVLKDGRTWGANKQDVTGAACAAGADHVLNHGKTVVVSCNGKPKYEISVVELKTD